MNKLCKWLFGGGLSLWCLVCWPNIWAQSPPSADQIFSNLEKSVFQVRIIEDKSGSQTALGTGFLVAGPRLATNYHVVSAAVMEPEKYRIQIKIDNVEWPLTLLNVDVVNDLALLQLPTELQTLPQPFELAHDQPKKGEPMYSLGNPHNLGMTIIEGNYNGLVEKKYLDRIHFSGAINSGMSGGPTVNAQSQVVGINVATAGNQVGFLVPVSALHRLLKESLSIKESTDAKSSNADLLRRMSEKLGATTDAMVRDLLVKPWTYEDMAKARILGNLAPWFDCWGDSQLDKETHMLTISRGCSTADQIFVTSQFNTGHFEYEYYYHEAKDWQPMSFYRFMRRSTQGARPGNDAEKEQVDNFKCENKIVHARLSEQTPNTRRRVSYCVRPYKKMPGLYDVFYFGVTLDQPNHAAIDHFTLSGVTAQSAQLFLEKFIEVLAWRS